MAAARAPPPPPRRARAGRSAVMVGSVQAAWSVVRCEARRVCIGRLTRALASHYATRRAHPVIRALATVGGVGYVAGRAGHRRLARRRCRFLPLLCRSAAARARWRAGSRVAGPADVAFWAADRADRIFPDTTTAASSSTRSRAWSSPGLFVPGTWGRGAGVRAASASSTSVKPWPAGLIDRARRRTAIGVVGRRPGGGRLRAGAGGAAPAGGSL